MKHKDTLPFKKRSRLNENRDSYVDAHGNYVYTQWEQNANGNWERRIVATIPFSDENRDIIIFLDSEDHNLDLNDRYESELRDALFDAKVAAAHGNEKAVDPWSTLADDSSSPEAILFPADKPKSPEVAQVRRIIEEECTPAQQDFFFEHFGCQTQLEEMRQAEAEQTGKLSSSAAMTNRKNKIIDKVAKSLGAERVKRHRYPTKG